MRDEHTIKVQEHPQTSQKVAKVESPMLSAISSYIEKTKEWDESLLKKEVA